MEHTDAQKLHIMFLPFMAHGHMIPTIDIAKLFASRGFQVSIVTTSGNAKGFVETLERTKNSGLPITIISTMFPSKDVGLPEGCENLDAVVAMDHENDLLFKFLLALSILRDPVEELIRDAKPHCLVADMMFPWATEAAATYAIPRLAFHGTCAFSLSMGECMRFAPPNLLVSSNSESFLIPNLPGEIKFSIKKFNDLQNDDPFHRFLNQCQESWVNCSGVIVNSFYELEPLYAEFYREASKGKTWYIGPVSLCNKAGDEKNQRGKQSSISVSDCISWLSSKNEGSVVYVCFGSITTLSCEQLIELAAGIEASGHNFIWVVGNARKSDTCKNDEDWLPRGFIERTKDRGLVIRGWAPQILILEHEAVGAFVTHCGWNSALEGISAGVAMVTWPMFADQFGNEKLLTEVLKVGVPVTEEELEVLKVGVPVTEEELGVVVKAEEIEKAIKRIMVGEEAREMNLRAKKLAEMAHRAVEVGGSSYCDFESLVNAIKFKQI